MQGRYVLVLVAAVPPLAAFAADSVADFVGAVGKQVRNARRSVGVRGEQRRVGVGLAHVIEVIGSSEAVYDLEADIDLFVDRILEAHAGGDGQGHGAVGFVAQVGGV